MKPRLGVLGPDGTYSSQAAREYLAKNNKDYEIVWCSKISQCYDKLKNRELEYSMVPLVNSLSGEVKETIEGLNDERIRIVNEITIPIHNYLMSTEKISISDIQYVHSKDKAINQCKNYLEKLSPYIKLIEEDSTSAAALKIKLLADSSHAAICPISCSKLYGLEIIGAEIEDATNNQTKFIMVTI